MLRVADRAGASRSPTIVRRTTVAVQARYDSVGMGYTRGNRRRFVYFHPITKAVSPATSNHPKAPDRLSHFRLRTRVCLLSLTLFLVPLLRAQQSPFLNDPDRFVDYVRQSADFWRTSHDDVGGGFFTNVARNGQVNTGWGTDKDMLTQSRNLYAMVRAFQLTGDESYLDLANSAFGFMTDHTWDDQGGGWFNDLSASGSPADPNGMKDAFFQHYALLGPLALAEATDDSTAWNWVMRSLDYLDEVLWDATPGREGYFDRVSRSGTFRTGKSFNATVDALTTHALSLMAARGDDRFRERLEALSGNILDHLVASMPDQAIGFAEEYDTNWAPLPDERLTIMGHVLKTSWVLARLNNLMPDSQRLDAAVQLADHVLEKGYDHDYGGPYKDYDRLTGQMQLWGLQDSTKAWWQMEQAFTAGMTLYRQTGEERFLEMADETVSFFMDHFVDPDYGEVYADRTRRGDGIPQWGDHKGDGYKAGYHSVEFGWYGYLYGQLTDLPVRQSGSAVIHYRFQARDDERTLALHPVESDPSTGRHYAIAGIHHDGQPWTHYNASDRTITLPEGTGGLFTVEFAGTAQVAVETTRPTTTRLTGLWPNPASSRATVEVELKGDGPIHLSVVDMLGRIVKEQHLSWYPAGRYQLPIDLSRLSSGSYTMVVTHASWRDTAPLLVIRN